MEGRSRVGTLIAGVGAGLYAWTPLSDRDWPWHLADFERMAREHALPWEDRFSWASEGPFVPVHWLFELLLGVAYGAFGLVGVEVVRAALVVATFALLERLLARRGLGPLASAGLALTVAALTRGRLLERPHLVTLLGLVFLWDRLVAWKDEKKSLWPLVPAFALWANAHPGVVYGAIFLVGFVGLEWIRGRRERAALGWGAGALAATLATPYDARLYPYLLGHRAMQAQMHIAELRPLDWKHLDDWTFTAAVLLAALVFLRGWRAGIRPSLTELLGTAGFLVLAALAARESNLALISLAVALAPVLAATVREAKDELAGKDGGLHVFAWSFALLLGFGFPAFELGRQLWEGDLGYEPRPWSYPVREADWILGNKPHGRLWNTNASGGYLLWRLDPLANPDWKVFSDGRQPLFVHAMGRELRDIVGKDAPNLLVFDPLEPPYDAMKWVQEEYALVHFSDGGRTYLRREGKDREVAERLAYRHLFFTAKQDPADVYGFRLVVQHDSEHPAEAKRELLSRALLEDPGGHWANVALAGILFQEGDKQGAAAAARRALEVKRNRDALEILRAAEGG